MFNQRLFRAVFTVAFVALFLAPAVGKQFDLIIRNASVVDGSGHRPYKADVAVNGDTIVAIGRLEDHTGLRMIDAQGRSLAPGFIDLHAHLDDGTRPKEKTLRSSNPRFRAALNYVTQGVTSAFVNPDGTQPDSLIEQRRDLERLGIGVNVALANGHDTLRRAVMGKDLKRPATSEELERMRVILRRSLESEGSFGLSLGLEYFSGLHSDTHELVELARELPAYNGVFIAHLRSQGSSPMWYKPSVHGEKPPPTLDQSLDEVFRVANETGCISVISHIKAWGPTYRGQSARIVTRIQEARDRGDRVFADIYPYDSAGSDGNFVALPPWAVKSNEDVPEDDKAHHDFRTAVRRAIADTQLRQNLQRDVEHQVALKGGAENIRILDYPDSSYVGHSLAELMARRGLSLTDLVVALQLEGDPAKPGGAKMRAFSMEESDVETFLAQPWTMGSTDGWIVLPEEAVGAFKYIGTNRRCFGSYVRRIEYVVLERKVETIEETVRKCTVLPAEILGLRDRGRILPGYKADLILFDPQKLHDNTTFLEPNKYASGMDFVFVNGVAVIDDGRLTLALPGRVLEPERNRH